MMISLPPNDTDKKCVKDEYGNVWTTLAEDKSGWLPNLENEFPVYSSIISSIFSNFPVSV